MFQVKIDLARHFHASLIEEFNRSYPGMVEVITYPTYRPDQIESRT